MTGISTEITLGSKYINIPYCLNENYSEKEIPFKYGDVNLFYLIDWYIPECLELLKEIAISFKDYINYED